MRKFVVLVVLAVCAGFAVVPTVEADVPIPTPAFCDPGREARFFVLGVRKGRNLADAAIARVGGLDACEDLDALDALREIIAEVVDGIAVPVGATEAVQCHVAGQVAGLLAEIEELQEECGGICIADGDFIGEISAQLYCALSIALDGLVPVELFERLATDACGVLFQVSCDYTFEAVATSDLECLPFTEGPFTAVFREVQSNQCADNPADPDP